MNEKIAFELVSCAEGIGYDLKILSDEATVADYLEALDAFLEAKVAPCLGCDGCCHERVPLTLVDLYRYAGHEPAAISAFVAEYCTLEEDGPALDLTIRRRDDESCIFLDRERKACLNYDKRSLVCHTYICLPQSKAAAELRSAIVNQGEDAAIGELLAYEGASLPARIMAHRGDYPPVDLWRQAVNGYADIKLSSLAAK